MASDCPDIAIPAWPSPFLHGMPRLSGRLSGVGAVKIVAIGSSTTAGEGDIVPYPQRLEHALRAGYVGRNIDVLNRGAGGEEAPEELRRLQRDVLDERPTVVIWQVGTNAVWKEQDLNATASAISSGLAMLAKAFVDVILMDLQFVPAVLIPSKAEAAFRMVEIIDQVANEADFPVNVFHRFDLMRQWHEAEKVSFRLHHGDWSARRMAEALASTIITAAAKTA